MEGGPKGDVCPKVLAEAPKGVVFRVVPELPKTEAALEVEDGIGATEVLRGDTGAPKDAAAGGAEVVVAATRGLGTLYFLASLSNISASRP